MSSSTACAQAKVPCSLLAGKLMPLPTLQHSWSHVALDFAHSQKLRVTPPFLLSLTGSPITSEVLKRFMEKLGISVSFRSGYHPQTNGQMECANQISHFLRTFCADNQWDWAHFIPWWSIHRTLSATHITPFQWIPRFKPPLFPWSASPMDSPAVDDWFRRREQVWENTHQHLEQAANQNK